MIRGKNLPIKWQQNPFSSPRIFILLIERTLLNLDVYHKRTQTYLEIYFYPILLLSKYKKENISDIS